MKRILMSTLIVTLIVLVFLLLPLIFKDRSRPALIGPDLSELEYSEIFFKNRYEDLRLSGMLFLPKNAKPFFAVIIIHGSGTSRRNSVWYLSVANHLQQNGIAVLLPDKRGSEKSEGEWVGASFEQLATDTLSAVEYVKNPQTFKYSSIGVIGMSQGGWIAPIVATKSDDVSFVVSMTDAAVTTDEQLLHEEINNIAKYTYAWIAKLIAPITTNKLKQNDHIRAHVGFDPIPYWKRIHVPVIFAFGENDENVPVDAAIDRLNENGLNLFYIKTYAKGGHAIRDIQTNKVNGEYLNDLVEFINGAM
jgi:dipeptidyl aminopeptidase/acylaminoacyl peptidase